MIAKLTTGNGFAGALKYDLRDGKLMEKKGTLPEQVRVLDAREVCIDFDDGCNMILDVKQVSWDFRQQAIAYRGKKPIEKPVYHWALSYHPDDVVTDEQMLEDAKEFLEQMGFGNTQYVITAHRDKEHPHVHVIANIVDDDGKRIPTYKMVDKAHKVAADITKAKGYIWGEKASNKTIENAYRPHEKVKMIIEPIINTAVSDSANFQQLRENLSKENISCIVKEAKDGKRGGISFGYEHLGQLHTFSGSSINRNLSYAHLKRRLEHNKHTLLYIVHSRTDASVYAIDPEYSYKEMDPLRQMLVNRGYMVASIARKDEYDRRIRLLEKRSGKQNYRVGSITIVENQIRFGKEKIFGDPEITAPAFSPERMAMLESSDNVSVSLKVGHDQRANGPAINKSELIDTDKKGKGIKI